MQSLGKILNVIRFLFATVRGCHSQRYNLSLFATD